MAIIIDEAHNLKNPNAAQTKAALDLMETVSPEYRILLTGTPILNRPQELMTQLCLLGRIDDFGGRKHFFSTYCAKPEPEALAALSVQLRSSCVIRRKKMEVLTELPPLQRVTVECEIDNLPVYMKAEDDIIDWLERHAAEYDVKFMDSIAHLPPSEQEKEIVAYNVARADAAERAEMLVRLNKLRLLAMRGKLNQFKQWLREFLDTGEKLVVFGWHTDILKEIAKEFGGSLILGEVSQKQRQEAIDQFQNDPESKLICLGLLAGGVGITLTAGANMAIIELPWRPGDVDQAEGRTHRFTQQRACTCYYHLAPETVDDYLWDIISEKRAIADAAIDGEIQVDREQVAAYQVLARIRAKVRQRRAENRQAMKAAAVHEAMSA